MKKKILRSKYFLIIMLAVVVGFFALATIFFNANMNGLVAISAASEDESLLSIGDFEANPPKDSNGNNQNFNKFTTDDSIVFYKQRMIDSAVVEKDQSVYVFDKSSKQLKAKKISYRSDLPQHLPGNLITKNQAEALVDGNSEVSTLYYIAPDSDVFNLNFDRSKPVWVVYTIDSDNKITLTTVINALDGKKIGNGLIPPGSSFSMTGPVYYGSSCGTSWDSWYTNAATWFGKMGYPATSQVWPVTNQIMANVQNNDAPLFYEIAHGGSTTFLNYCSGSSYTLVTSSDIRNWIAPYAPKKFTFIASCDGLCSTGAGTFSYEFKKASTTGAAAVGYCGMSHTECSSCWNYSVAWQDDLFRHMSQGSSVKAAFDQANINYPSCGVNNCMRFDGDPNFIVDNNSSGDTILPTVLLTSPSDASTVSGNTIIGVTALDNVGVTKVEFYKNNILLGIDTNSPYQYTWNTTGVLNGIYNLSAKAYDAADNIGVSNTVSVTVTSDTQAPEVTIISPLANSTIPSKGNLNISAVASDNVGVEVINIYFDGQVVKTCSLGTDCSYKYATRKISAGNHTITVDASDAEGNTRSSTITVVK